MDRKFLLPLCVFLCTYLVKEKTCFCTYLMNCNENARVPRM